MDNQHLQINGNGLDELLIKDINELKYKVKKIIYENPMKKRYTLIVSQNGSDYILKWNHPSEKSHVNKLKKEINFYEENKDKSFLPDLIYSENHMIILEYIDSITLREWLIDYTLTLNEDTIGENFEVKLDNLLTHIKALYQETNSKLTLDTAVDSIVTYVGKLCTSVPMSVPGNRFESFLLKLNWRLSKKKIRHAVREIMFKYTEKDSKTLSAFSIHADLHLNNIIVSRINNDIKILDWENGKEGTVFEDINYLLAFTNGLFSKFPKHQIYIRKKFDEIVQESDNNKLEPFRELHVLYVSAIAVNRSFSNNSSIIGFLINIVKFQRRIRIIR